MMTTSAVLEPEAQKVADLTAKPPFLYQLGSDGARKVLNPIWPTRAATAAIEQAIHSLRKALGT